MSDAVKEMRRLIDQLNEASRTYYQGSPGDHEQLRL